MDETAGPSIDGSNWVGARLLALLVLAEVARDRAVRSFGLDGLAIRRDQH